MSLVDDIDKPDTILAFLVAAALQYAFTRDLQKGVVYAALFVLTFLALKPAIAGAGLA